MIDNWVPILIVEIDVSDIGWMLFREKFGLADNEPAPEDLKVVQVHGRPPLKVYARYSVRKRKLMQLGLDGKELPFMP